MINIAICDDEPAVLKSVAKITESALITTDFDADITLVTSDQNKVYNSIMNNEIDVLFLDIDFNNDGKNGIDFATDLRKINKDFKLIFLTGHFEYAMLAYKCKTFDYLMKPIDTNKVITILNRLKEDLSSSDLGLFKINKDYSLRLKDILFIERNKSKAMVYTNDGIYETNYSLNSIKDHLPDSFIRVHRSYIVNREQIYKINKENKTIYFSENISCPLGNFNY